MSECTPQPSSLKVVPHDPVHELDAYADQLRKWLLETAFDLWWSHGADGAGGFHERISFQGEPVLDDHRRARVQPRQAYCYAVAGTLGWDGPWEEAVGHALDWFERTYRRPDRLYGTLANRSGELIDNSFDLYNHSFALLGLASAAGVFPSRFDDFHSQALELLALLKAGYRHPLGGFHQAVPASEPLCSNPHMHMLEASLAWEAITQGEPTWVTLSDEIANLALTCMIDASSGALREFFDLNWQPMSGVQGRILEPGHQFEWAWLLAIWSTRRSNERALESARILFDVAERHGICPTREIAIMELHDDFSVRNDLGRLWSQTEWLKAAIRLAKLSTGGERRRYFNSALKATAALRKFIDGAPPGLWHDKYVFASGLLDEPAPASSFYHIVAAYNELESLNASLEI